MKNNFWAKLAKPCFLLAPMAGITDTVFRQLVSKYGKPDVLFTEFVSCDGLCSIGREKLYDTLWYTEDQRPIVAQIFGSNPENFYRTSQWLVESGFDGIDINTGCPDKSVEKQGAGAALMKDPVRTKEIIQATKEGAGALPVSIKTRLGYNHNDLHTWLRYLLSVEPVAITIHARTRNEMSKVPARWEAISEAVSIRNQEQSDTLIIGNGDVRNLQEAQKMTDKSNADGIMIGRGIFGNPWLFNSEQDKSFTDWKKQIDMVVEHASLFDRVYGRMKNFAVVRRFFKSYIAGFPHSKQLKTRLMESCNLEDIHIAVKDIR